MLATCRFRVFASIVLVQLTIATKQDLPASCLGQSECVDYLSDSQWEKLTEQCCADHPDTVYHCQEHDGEVIVACLPPESCPLGQVSMLTEDRDGTSRHVSLTCKKCDEGYYQPLDKSSYQYRYPICERTKQTCPADSGKALVSVGDSSQDSLCRCRWEEGWVPRFKGSQCTDPAGFVRESLCDCVPHDCEEGQRPNQDYQCVDTTSIPPSAQATSPLPATTPRTDKADRKRAEFIPRDRKFTGGLSENEFNEHQRDVWATILSVIAAVAAAIPVAIIVYSFNRLVRV